MIRERSEIRRPGIGRRARPSPSASSAREEGRLSRREALRALGAGAVGAGLGLGLPRWLEGAEAGRIPPPLPSVPARRVSPRVWPLPLGSVRLLDGPFRRASERGAGYMLDLDPDRLLHNFRVNAGLEPKAPVYGGWESQEPWVEIRCHGHTLGHWLTAGSYRVATAGDHRFQERIDYIVDELQRCQEAGGTGLVCAFPDGAGSLLRAVRGERYPGVPWYTMHKVFAGLRDAYVHAGSEPALETLVRLSDWAHEVTSPMSDAAMQRMLDREHGGMNEVLADVYAITGDERYLEMARRFSHRAVLDPLSRGVDPLNGLHANTQIPKVVGFQRIYELTGRSEYHAAARFFWDVVVRERSFVTGGHGDVEHFFPPADFPRHLHSAKTAETCGSYNMLRLTRMLFGDDPSPAYADYYEHALYNTILSSQDPDSGWCTYFQAIRPGYLKLYHTPHDSFWCCTGTGMENHAKHNDSIYFESEDALWVNLFIPSEVSWERTGLELRQETRFPEEGTTRLEVTGGGPARTTIRVRRPGWADGGRVTVNGRAVDLSGGPAGYVELEREWRPGDVVEARYPLRLHTRALPGEPGRVAVLYGPIVLAGRLGREGLFPGADILRNERTSGMILDSPIEVPRLALDPRDPGRHIRRIPGEGLAFETVGIGVPEDVVLVPYHALHHERYNLYWELV